MSNPVKTFDYEDTCMGARGSRPETYRLTFADDYRLRSLTQMLKLRTGRLLDIGCGGGRFVEALPHYYPKVRMFGCDISGSAIAYAKKFGSGNVSYSRIIGKKLPYANGYFDACICFDVLEHVPDARFLIQEIRRVLKKRGKLILIVPCEGQPFTYTWFFQKLHIGERLTFRFFGHIHPEFTHENVLTLLKAQGFDVQIVRYSEHVIYQWIHVCIFFLPKILLELVFGAKVAHAYTNSSLLQAPKRGFSPLLVVRNVWFHLFSFLMMYPMSWETILMKNIPFAAWKLHAAAEKRG